jgi:hypothetical protein
MAELPRYQQTGRVFADLPQFDFANVREAFRSSQTLTSALDRVTDFANKSAAKTAEAKAERFSIDNPLTLEQVQQAAKSGITPEDLVAASGGGQIWQDTVRKLQGEQLRTQLEVLGKQALLDLQTQVDTNQISNMDEVRAKQEAIVNGLRKTLSFSPDAVLKFDSSMGTVTSSLYKEAQNKLVKDYKLSQQAQGIQNLDNSVKAFQALIKHEEVTDPAMIKDIELALADQLERQSAEGGAEFALAQRTAFVKKMTEAKINLLTEIAVSDEFAADRYEAMVKIRNNDFGDKTVIYNSFDEDDKKKVRVAASEAWTSLEQSKSQKQKEEKEVADKTFRTNVIAKTSRGKSGKLNTFDSAFLDGALSYSEWKSANNPEGEMGDPLLLSNIENKILDNKITALDQLPAGLSPKAKAKFNLLIRNQDEKNAKRIIRQGANISEGSAFHTTSQSEKYASIEVIYDQLQSETDSNGNLKYSTKSEAATEAIKKHNGSTLVVDALNAQRRALTTATKEVDAANFDYDIPREKEALEKYADKNVSFSQRKTWVNAVLKYQKNKSTTGKNVSNVFDIEQGNN